VATPWLPWLYSRRAIFLHSDPAAALCRRHSESGELPTPLQSENWAKSYFGVKFQYTGKRTITGLPEKKPA